MAKGDVKVVLVGDAKDLQKAFQDSEDAAGSFDSKIGSVASSAATAIAGIALAAGAAAVAVGVALEAVGNQFDEAYDHIRVATGATGDKLAGLQESVKNIAQDSPESINDIGTALSILGARLDMTGPAAEGLAKQFLNLSHITGADLAETMKSATGTFNAFNVPASQMPGKLDEMFRATQKSGLSVSDLSSQMNTAGTVMRGLGFTFDDTVAIIGNLGKYGLDTSEIMAGMKKELADAAKHGISANVAFDNLLRVIKTAPNDTAAAAYAMDHLGARSGPMFAQLVRQGKFSYEDFKKAIENGSDTINQATDDTADWQEKLARLVNMIKVEVEPVASAVFDAIGTAVSGIKDLVHGLIDAYNQGGFGGLVDKFKEDIGNLRDWLANTAWPTVRDGALRFLGAVKDWALKVAPEVGRAFVGWYHSFTDWVAGVWNGIDGDGLSQKLGTLYGQFSSWIRARAPQVEDAFRGWFHSASDWASGIWNGTDGGEGLSQKLGRAWGSITGWVTDRKDDLANNWQGWVHSATEWLDNVVQQMPANLDKILKAIDDWCDDENNINNLIENGNKIGEKVVGGVLLGLGFLALKAGPIVFREMGKVVLHAIEVVDSLPGKLLEAGVKAAIGLGKGLVSGIIGLKEDVDKAITSILPPWLKGAYNTATFGVGNKAVGGMLGDGMSWVGENGPELAVKHGSNTMIIPTTHAPAHTNEGEKRQPVSETINLVLDGQVIATHIRRRELALR